MFLGIRFTLAAFILATLCKDDLLSLTKRQWKNSLGTGVLLGLSLLIWIQGLYATDSVGESAFIVSLTVVIIPLISSLFFGEKLSTRLLIALLPAVGGLALLTINNDDSGIGIKVEAAHIYFLISTVGFALHVILTAKFAQTLPSLPLTSIQLLTIGLIGALASSLTETVPSSVSGVIWIWVLCSALISTSLRFALQNRALVHLNPSQAGMIFMLEPVWAALLGMLFLGENMSSFQIIGCCFIFLALIIYRAPLPKFKK